MNIIAQAAENLKGHWYKGAISPDNDNTCGIGHLVRAAKGGRYSHGAELMDRVAVEQYPDRAFWDLDHCPFANFNDHPDTTEDEVLAVMEKAAIKFDEQV